MITPISFKDRSYEKLSKVYEDSKSWITTYQNCYQGVSEDSEAFIDLVTEITGKEIKGGDHLQELTEITHLDTYNVKTGEYEEPKTEEEAKENAKRELEHLLIDGRHCTYLRELTDILSRGGKYKELLEVDPKDYKLPETWSLSFTNNKETAILFSINLAYCLGEPGRNMSHPNLRTIVDHLEAPYSVIVDALLLTES